MTEFSRLAMEASEEGYIDVNVDTGEFVTSGRLNEIFGIAPGIRFSVRTDFLSHVRFYGDDGETYRQAIGAVEARGGPDRYQFDFRIVLASGEVRWLWTRGRVTRDAEGRARRRIGVFADVTARKLAEAALRDSEGRYARAMDTTEEGHWEWHVESDDIFVSPRINELFGFPASQRFVTRSELTALAPYHPDDRPLIDAAVLGALQGSSERTEFEYRVKLPHGEIRWLRARWKIMRRPDFAPFRVTGVLTDITARRQAVEDLKRAQAYLSEALRLGQAGSFAFDLRTNRHLHWSPELYAIFDFDPAAGLPEVEQVRARIHPDDAQRVSEVRSRSLREGIDRDIEYRVVRGDGSIRHVHVVGRHIMGDDGKPSEIVGIVMDISERKQAETALRSRQEMLELAQKAAGAVAFDWRIDAAERKNLWSPELEAMYGLNPGTYDGSFKRFKELVHADDWPTVHAAILHANATGDVAAEYRVIHPGGEVRWLQAKGRMLVDADGKSRRVIGFMMDVTERHEAEEAVRRLERQLRQSQRLEAMGTLAGGIAHDFNNILGAILGFSEMALRTTRSSRLRRDLECIAEAGERGRALVDRILAFSRSGEGERVAVHVENVIRKASDLLSPNLPKNINVDLQLSAGNSAIQGDPTQVHQVLMNLMTNAAQAMPKGGRLCVSLKVRSLSEEKVVSTGTLPTGDYVVLEVADEGTGIPAAIVERIFDPFFTTKDVGVGTGLGLSLVHGIVSEVGGAIDVATKMGEGSVFTVYMPRAGEAEEERKDSEPAVPRGAQQRVLVVDDEEQLVRLATRTLTALGYAPVGFTSSKAALEAFSADPSGFDALITDERMPGMSGSVLIGRVRTIRRDIPILLVSGYVGGSIVRRAYNAGADEVLRKPLSTRDLANTLARVLQL